MQAILVADENWAIGRDNNLLVHLPGELKYFKEKTWGKNVIIGRKTLESFPGGKPLPGRNNIVLTSNEDYEKQSCSICYSFEGIMKKLKGYKTEDVFIAGGESIYKQFMPYCDTVYVTKIFAKFKADKYFENLDKNDSFEKTWTSEVKEENGIRYQFAKYQRK